MIYASLFESQHYSTVIFWWQISYFYLVLCGKIFVYIYVCVCVQYISHAYRKFSNDIFRTLQINWYLRTVSYLRILF